MFLTSSSRGAAHGAKVKAFDPEAMQEVHEIYGERDDLSLCKNPILAIDDVDALIVVTEWHIFRNPDFAVIKDKLRQPVIFDGRNIYDPTELQVQGVDYFSIGRQTQTVAAAVALNEN